MGDSVVTRLNQRALVTGRGWVKNGDVWIVQSINENGSFRLTRPGGGAVPVVPKEYAAEHLELGYATTAHRAQGRTVETAHAYVNSSTKREPLYVMASRGRESNSLYVDTASDSRCAHDHRHDSGEFDASAVLHAAIAPAAPTHPPPR